VALIRALEDVAILQSFSGQDTCCKGMGADASAVTVLWEFAPSAWTDFHLQVAVPAWRTQ
jgi:hypothetical protein